MTDLPELLARARRLAKDATPYLYGEGIYVTGSVSTIRVPNQVDFLHITHNASPDVTLALLECAEALAEEYFEGDDSSVETAIRRGERKRLALDCLTEVMRRGTTQHNEQTPRG
jgi:hypothetical protein